MSASDKLMSTNEHPILSEIRARCEAATPGPWGSSGGEVRSSGACNVSVAWCSASMVCGLDGSYGITTRESRANAELCSHARTDVPFLLRIIERMRDTLAYVYEIGGGGSDSQSDADAALAAAVEAAKEGGRG